MKTKVIEFKNVCDFKNRIAKLWQDQKDDETYQFIFPDNETKLAFYALAKRFSTDEQEGANDGMEKYLG